MNTEQTVSIKLKDMGNTMELVPVHCTGDPSDNEHPKCQMPFLQQFAEWHSKKMIRQSHNLDSTQHVETLPAMGKKTTLSHSSHWLSLGILQVNWPTAQLLWQTKWQFKTHFNKTILYHRSLSTFTHTLFSDFFQTVPDLWNKTLVMFIANSNST